MRNFKKYLLFILFIAMLLSVASCAGKGDLVNKDNYEKIETGMSISDAKSILGEPTQVLTLGDPNTGQYIWMTKDRKQIINLGVENGKVKTKQWKESKKK